MLEMKPYNIQQTFLSCFYIKISFSRRIIKISRRIIKELHKMG